MVFGNSFLTPFPLALIAACNQDRIIGYQGKIPWHSPKDFRFFRNMTVHSVCWMGRKTLMSLPKLLPNRLHVVFSRHSESVWDSDWLRSQREKISEDNIKKSLIVVSDMQEAVRVTQEVRSSQPEFQNNLVYCIGGADLYQQMLPYSQWIILTRIMTETVLGDAFFPDVLHDPEWKIVLRHFDLEAETQFKLEFILLCRAQLPLSGEDYLAVLRRFQRALGFELVA